MAPELTAVPAPIHLRIADAIRIQIEEGQLRPGDALPTLHELAAQWSCSITSIRRITRSASTLSRSCKVR